MIGKRSLGKPFWFLCLSIFIFFFGFNTIIGELPSFLDSLGGGDYKGYIIGLFTIVAAFSRPISGKLSDQIGRIPIIAFGVFISFICGWLYIFVNSVAFFFFVRLLHGLSTGFSPTGATALLADVVAPDRRGEAMGYLGLFINLGMALGPVFGSSIKNHFGYDVMFASSSILTVISFLLVFRIGETLENKKSFSIDLLKLKKTDIFDRLVIVPAFVMVFSVFTFGAVLTVLPDFSQHLGFVNKSTFLLFYTVFTMVLRVFGGRFSDKMGRINILILAMVILSVATMVLGSATTKFQLLLGSAMYGLATGFSSPTLFAWCIDLSSDESRGRALSLLYMSLEIGIGIGAFTSGAIYANQFANLPYVFYYCTATALIALGILIWYKFRLKKLNRQI